jgi:hypothetical protein
MRKLGKIIKEVIYKAYFRKKAKIDYKNDNGKPLLSIVVDSSSQFLALYLAFSDVVTKLFGLIEIPASFLLGKIIGSGVGTFICGYMLLSTTKGPDNKLFYQYDKISRTIAQVFILFMLYGLISSFWSFMFDSKTYVDMANHHSMPVKASSWKINTNSKIKSPDFVKYTLDINKINYDDLKFKHLGILIEPYTDFQLEDVSPDSSKQPRDRKYDPMEIGNLEPKRSEWNIPYFENSFGWKISVTVKRTNEKISFPKEAPLQTTIYFYK